MSINMQAKQKPHKAALFRRLCKVPGWLDYSGSAVMQQGFIRLAGMCAITFTL